MFYKNTAGQVVQAQLTTLSDGSEFTGSVTCYVTGDGGTQAVGSVGSGACTHEGHGLHSYAPSQAETNYETVSYTFVGTGAGTVSVHHNPDTVKADIAALDAVADAIKVKTDFLPSETAGSAGGVFIAGTNAATTVNFTGNLSGSVGSVTGAVGSVTGNVGGNVTGSVGSISGITFPTNFAAMAITVGGAVTVGTNSDKTGYSLTQSFPTNFAAMAITAGGAVTVGTNSDKTGYSLTQSFPANFASLGITAGGAVTVGTNNDKTGYSLTQSFPANFASMSIDANGRLDIIKVAGTTQTTGDIYGAVPGLVWDVVLSGHLTAGSTGAALNAAGSAGDPWVTALPGAYGAGSAGKILGDALTGHVAQTGDGYDLLQNNVYGLAEIRSAIDLVSLSIVGIPASTMNALDSTSIPGTPTPGSYAEAVSRIDVSVSSRLATAGYTAPPSVTDNATQVRTELTTELARIDASISSRASQTSADSAVTNTASLPGMISGGQFTVLALANAPAGGGGGANPISAQYETDGHIWKFPYVGQIVGKPDAVELSTFEGLLVMDLQTVLAAEVDILTATLVSVTNSADIAVTEPLSLAPNKQAVHITVATSTVNDYLFTIEITTTDSQVFQRQGILKIRSA